MSVQATNDWLWIETEEGVLSGEKTTSSGIVVTSDNSSSNGLVEGLVIAGGPGRYGTDGKLIPMRVFKGDKVMFTKSMGLQNKIQYDGKEYVLIREENVMAVIKED